MLKKPYLAKSTTSETEVVHTIYDPAIDLDASDLAAYLTTHDKAHLVIKPGQTPAKFHIRPLSRPKVNRIRLGAHADVERADRTVPEGALIMAVQARAFKLGCFKITDCPAEQHDGSETLIEISPAEAEEFMDPAVIEDIGERVLGISVAAWSGERSPGK